MDAHLKAHPHSRSERVADWFKTLGILGAATALSLVLERIGFTEVTIILAYVLGSVLIATLTTGYQYGIIGSVAGVLLFNFFFTAPRYSLTVHDPQYLVTFAVMLMVSMITSALTINMKKQARLAAIRQRRAELQTQIIRILVKSEGVEGTYRAAAEALSHALGCEARVYVMDRERHLSGMDGEGVLPQTADPDPEAIETVFRTGVPQTVKKKDAPERTYLVPIIGASRILGVLSVPTVSDDEAGLDVASVLESVAAQVALAVEREIGLAAEQQTRLEIERERFRNTLLRSVSHDLRTPLTGIAGAVGTVLENYDQLNDDTKKRLLVNMESEAHWLIRLVENLLSLTRLESGSLSLSMKLEAVEEVIAEAVAQIRKRAADRVIRITMPKEVVFLPMEGSLIEQVMINLMDNAVKHTPEGTAVEVSVRLDTDKVWFEVRDHGNGIPDKDLPHLFELFFTRTEGSRDIKKGTGLGLSICEAIVRAHKGEIYAVNHPDGGAQFRFYLPMGEQEGSYE